MYAKNDKRRLYQLMDMYLDGVLTASVFCDEFYYAYDLEIADKDLTETERYMFTELDKISSRFSEFESDHQLDPKAFSTEYELRQKILEVRNILKNENMI